MGLLGRCDVRGLMTGVMVKCSVTCVCGGRGEPNAYPVYRGVVRRVPSPLCGIPGGGKSLFCACSRFYVISRGFGEFYSRETCPRLAFITLAGSMKCCFFVPRSVCGLSCVHQGMRFVSGQTYYNYCSRIVKVSPDCGGVGFSVPAGSFVYHSRCGFKSCKYGSPLVVIKLSATATVGSCNLVNVCCSGIFL